MYYGPGPKSIAVTHDANNSYLTKLTKLGPFQISNTRGSGLKSLLINLPFLLWTKPTCKRTQQMDN